MKLSRRWLTSFACLSSLLASSCGPSEPDGILEAGRYRGDGITLTLEEKAGSWQGQIQLGNKTFEARATWRAPSLTGSFRDGTNSFPFTMKQTGDGWELKSGDTRYKLDREVVKNPLAEKSPPAKGNPLAAKSNQNNKSAAKGTPTQSDGQKGGERTDVKIEITDAGRVAVSGKIYKHPLGFRFRYPDNWQLRLVDEGILSLIPGDVLKEAQGPLEIILILGDSADGIRDAKSPTIAGFLDKLLTSSFPFFKRVGKPMEQRLGGREFSRHAWQGTNPAGKSFEARAWACILQDTALGLIALMPKAQLEKRKPVLEAMAASFHFVEPARDPRLVGGWRNETSFSSGTYSSTTSRLMELRADGTSTWGSRFMAGMTHTNSGGQETESSSADSGRGSLLKGRWAAANKRLYITWQSGSEEEFSYYREGKSMLLTPRDGGKKQLWMKIR